jgi:hypothetical protein
VSLNVRGKYNYLNLFIMKKLSLENLKLEADDMLQRSQLKTVFGGYNGGTGVQCRCKNRHTGAEWFGNVDDCEECGNWCANNVPQGHTYTSWICTGPLVQY